MMIEEIMLMAMVGQMGLTCAMIWKLILLDRKQQSNIYGVSHVWGSLMELRQELKAYGILPPIPPPPIFNKLEEKEEKEPELDGLPYPPLPPVLNP
jgi:hypothetical protein